MEYPMPRIKHRFIKRKNGWTYIWILISVALMSLGLTVAVEIDSTATRRDKEKELLAIGHQFRDAIKSYYETQVSGMVVREYPVKLEDLLKDDRSGRSRHHLRKIFVDPMSGKAEWGFIIISGRIVGIHSLSKTTPIKQDGFDLDDFHFRGKQRYDEWIFTYPVNPVSVRTAAP